MRQKGSIILALLFIFFLIALGVVFVYQVYVEENGTQSGRVDFREITKDQDTILVQ